MNPFSRDFRGVRSHFSTKKDVKARRTRIHQPIKTHHHPLASAGASIEEPDVLLFQNPGRIKRKSERDANPAVEYMLALRKEPG
jgi:formate-dependent nitrite reductase cytochrome c552 subunit